MNIATRVAALAAPLAAWPCAAPAEVDPRGAADTLVASHDETITAPVKKLGIVTITGGRGTSLPSQIPTTIEGISGADVQTKINAADSEDALRYLPSLLVRRRYIGDYNHAVLSSRASGTGNSARTNKPFSHSAKFCWLRGERSEGGSANTQSGIMKL